MLALGTVEVVVVGLTTGKTTPPPPPPLPGQTPAGTVVEVVVDEVVVVEVDVVEVDVVEVDVVVDVEVVEDVVVEDVVVVVELVVVPGPVTDSASRWGLVARGCCEASVAATVTLPSNGAVGVPLMTPVAASSDNEVGKPAAVHV